MSFASSNPFSVSVKAATPPPPPAGFSPDGTTLDVRSPAGATIVEKGGAAWTAGLQIGGTAAQISAWRDGVRKAQSVDLLTIKAGEVYNKDTLAGTSGTGWEKWTAAGWLETPAPF